ncbi:MAG TPA: outer membrane beta-barrel protein [Puia sp.]|jgi:hypothetical protein|nr:outer membrane beta-barrel protein [Puia sp.]
MEEHRPDHLDKLFTDSLRSFEDRPAKEVWEKIEQELDGDKRRVRFLIFRHIKVVAACLLALSLALGILLHVGRKTDLAHNSEVFHHKSGNTGASTIATVTPSSTFTPPSPPAGIHLPHSSTPDKYFTVTVPSAPNAAEWRPPHDGLSALLQPLQRTTSRIQPTTSRIQPTTPRAIEGIPQLLNGHVDKYSKGNAIHLVTRLHRWSINGYFSHELAGYNLSDHDSIGAGHKEFDKKETSLVSASAGILVGYQLTKKWLLQTGLLYSWSSSLGEPSTAYAVTDNNGNTKYLLNTIAGYGYLPSTSLAGDSVKTDQSSSRLHYISIPIIASYTFHKRQFTFLAGAGLMGNFLTGATVRSRIEGGSAPQPESIVTLYGLRKITYGLLFKTEVQYAILPDWSLNLIATSKNALTAINTNSHYSTYPYYMGVGLGIKHTF